MEIEFWGLLLLPLFFGLGWLAARIDIRQVVRESRRLPRSYLNGLNFLLNEQPDKAIDAFIEAVKVDPQTIELHFALGSLFRRRGETERAIRMHQNLIRREDLTEKQRLKALLALGEDYLKAGLLDRAEEVFIKLRGSQHEERATKYLLDIYQQEKDWAKAIEVAQDLSDHEQIHLHKEMANFYCEQASSALANSQPLEADHYLDQALAVNPRCVRANLIRGDLLVGQHQDAAALVAWKRIENQDPAYLSLVAERIVEASARLEQLDQAHTLLRSWFEHHPTLDLLSQIFQLELDRHGVQSAYVMVREELRRNPSLSGLEKLLQAARQLKIAPARRDDIDLVRQLIHAHTRRVARYYCAACGFKARQFHWRCPACGGWETYPPRRTEEFDWVP